MTALNPRDSYAYELIAAIYIEQEDYDEAIDPFARAAQLAPDRLSMFHERGLVYWRLNLLEKALVDLNTVIKFDDTLSSAYTNRGIIYADLGLYELAQADYNHAIELDPNNSIAYYNRGVNYEALNMQALGEADYQQAINLDPYDGIPHLALAANYLERGDYLQAQSHYDRFMELTNGVVPRQFIETKRFVEQSLQSRQEDTLNLRNVAIIVLSGIAGFLIYRIRQTTKPTSNTRYKGR